MRKIMCTISLYSQKFIVPLGKRNYVKFYFSNYGKPSTIVEIISNL